MGKVNAKRHVKKSIDPFVDALRQWWDEGVHNARELHRRLAAQGYAGSWYCVRRLVAPWRDPRERTTGKKPSRRSDPASAAKISSNRLSWLLLKDDIKRTPTESSLLAKLLDESPEIRLATELAKSFHAVVKERSVEKLKAWMTRAGDASAPFELREFAAGLEQDWPEVRAAMEHRWSNGLAEGHVNRLKLIKRKMYGRAKFDLLRIRVLASGP